MPKRIGELSADFPDHGMAVAIQVSSDEMPGKTLRDRMTSIAEAVNRKM